MAFFVANGDSGFGIPLSGVATNLRGVLGTGKWVMVRLLVAAAVASPAPNLV